MRLRAAGWGETRALDITVPDVEAWFEELATLPIGRQYGEGRQPAEPGELKISGDSKLVIEQIRGNWRVNAEPLLPLHARATRLIDELATAGWKVSLTWVDRGKNIRADAASTAALIERGIEIARRDPAPGYTTCFRDIAEGLNISSIGVGRVLDALGLRNGKEGATERAIDEKYAARRFNGFGPVVDWNEEKVSAAVADFLCDEKRAAAIHVERLRPKRGPVLAKHLCGHETAVGLRPSKKAIEAVRVSLCKDCLAGDKVRFAQERARVVALCGQGDTLVDAIETVVEGPRLRPGVFLACWGWWAQQEREKTLARYRGRCEKPGLHPDVLAAQAALEDMKQGELARLVRAALNA